MISTACAQFKSYSLVWSEHFCLFLDFPSLPECLKQSSSSIGTIAHCGLWPVKKCSSIISYLPPTLSIFSLPAHEDLFLLPLSIFSWVLPFFSSLPVLEWRSFLGILSSSILSRWPNPLILCPFICVLLYFLLCSFHLVLDSSDFSIPHFHI